MSQDSFDEFFEQKTQSQSQFDRFRSKAKYLEYSLLQPSTDKAQTQRSKPGALPNSDIEFLAFNCPTSWGAVQTRGDSLQPLKKILVKF